MVDEPCNHVTVFMCMLSERLAREVLRNMGDNIIS